MQARFRVQTRAALIAAAVTHLMLAAPIAAQSAAQRPGTNRPARLDALDYAFKFASAIQSDPKDMGQAQASVVMDYASAGSLSEAMTHADRIEGWRRGTTYADLATLLANENRQAEAESMLGKAVDFNKTQTGWQAKRIESHIAGALSALGKVEESKAIAGRLAQEDPQQYTGKGVATVATGHARRGEYDVAMTQLDLLEKDPDIDSAWWRTAGYVSLASRTGLPREKRVEAIHQALEASVKISGWRRGEALRSIAEASDRLGLRKEAKEALMDAGKIFDTLPPGMPVKAALLANLARSWASLGEPERSNRLLESAVKLAPEATPIERPAIYANIAYAYQATGQTMEARATYDRALSEAESLTNSRPRALAVVEICRSLGRSQVDLDETMRSRLDRIFGNLSDPW